jgi:rubredoxin
LGEKMAKYICLVCQWIYDEEKEGRSFSELSDDWLCPECGVGKDQFEVMKE